MNAEFNWWLLIVGLVVGAALVYLVLADASRREVDVTDRERPLEVAWVASILADEGRPLPPETVERVLELHREYLGGPPPDDVIEPQEPPAHAPGPAGEASSAGGDEPDVERDRAQPEPPDADLDEPGRAHQP